MSVALRNLAQFFLAASASISRITGLLVLLSPMRVAISIVGDKCAHLRFIALSPTFRISEVASSVVP